MCLKLSLCLSRSRTQAGELGTLGWWWAPGKGAQPGQGVRLEQWALGRAAEPDLGVHCCPEPCRVQLCRHLLLLSRAWGLPNQGHS